MGRPRKVIKEDKVVKETKKKFTCINCGNEYVETNFYKSKSVFFSGNQKIPYCKQCVEKLYQHYYGKYVNEGSLIPEKKAIKRICSAFDIYYGEDVYAASISRKRECDETSSPMSLYMRAVHLNQYSRYSYDKTIDDDEQKSFELSGLKSVNAYEVNVSEDIVNFFGDGFVKEDYEYLKREYDDWVARHECNTKAQEEVFKRLCFTSLELLKASRRGEDTKNLNDTYLKQLDAAKLQPKQSKGDTTAETQTFGTLIDKWENTEPIPEPDEEFRDVDKIGFLIHVFYTGHIAKVLNFGSSLTNLYDKYIKKYTIEKKERNSESDDEVLFDKIFGKKLAEIDEQDI